MKNVKKIQTLLLNWFDKNKRDFPWRRTNNPYHILVAEKLLQQTVARSYVVDAYENILSRYPSPEDLATAKIEDLKKIIRPLGLTYRANELIKMSQEVSRNHKNKIPADLQELLSLTGVGDYSARAVLSFAYNENLPVVDTNIARFLHRLLGLGNLVPENPARSTKLRQYAIELLPQGKSREFNLALIDLCSAICKSKNPQCSICPIQQHCEFGKNNLAS
jgi:A/G-specific adenine glycosylase